MSQRTAIITGASQGLGLALGRRLVDDGWAVAIDARRADRLADATAELAERAADPDLVEAVVGDVSDPEHRRALVDAARRLGEVHLVVNNASTLGASPLPHLDELDDDTLRRVLEVNVVAPVALARELADDLAPGAVVVNVSSDAATGAYEGWGGYGASKAALDQVSRVLAAEHPEWRVLAVDPGDMRTELHQDAFPGEDIGDRPDPDGAAASIVALVAGDHPSGRYAAAEVVPT